MFLRELGGDLLTGEHPIMDGRFSQDGNPWTMIGARKIQCSTSRAPMAGQRAMRKKQSHWRKNKRWKGVRGYHGRREQFYGDRCQAKFAEREGPIGWRSTSARAEAIEVGAHGGLPGPFLQTTII